MDAAHLQPGEARLLEAERFVGAGVTAACAGIDEPGALTEPAHAIARVRGMPLTSVAAYVMVLDKRLEIDTVYSGRIVDVRGRFNYADFDPLHALV